MHITPAEKRWRPWIEAHQRTGFTVRAFCNENGLKYSTFAWWKRRIRNLDRARSETQFIALTVAEPRKALTLTLWERRVEVPVDMDTDLTLLRRVVEALS